MIYCFGEFEFDDDHLELRRAGRAVKTEALAKRLLSALLRRAGELVTKDELIEEVWEGRAVADNVLTVAMARLRKALSTGRDEPEHVLTVYGRGYRFAGALLTRERPEPQRFVPDAPKERTDSLFVGRDRVLDRLDLAFAEARRGQGRICVLIGEAGIGKTRAVESFEQKLRGTDARVVWGFCREVGDTPPLSPWVRLLQEVVALSAAGDRELNLAHALTDVEALLRSAGSADATSDLLTGANQTPVGAARHQSFDVFARAFSRAAASTPTVLVLDDLHRADAGSIELLSYLADEIARSRILVVATLRHPPGRSAPRPETQLPYVLGHRNCERIALLRLHEEDVAEYVAAQFDDADGRLGRAVFEKSEGNPFYMTELARQLRDADRPSADQLSIPDVALDLIRQRVAKLDYESREVLAAAAVIGRSFELSLLRTVTGKEPSELMTSLDAAIAADLVVAASESSTAFAFGHDLMRAVLYDALPPAKQRRWHIRTAEALEQRLDLGEPVPPSELAYHLHAALPESDLRKTVDFSRAAANAAAWVYATSDVVRYLRQALQALGLMESPSVRLRLSLWYQIALWGRAQPSPDYVRWISELVRLSREHGQTHMVLRAAIMLNAHPGFKPVAGGRAALEHALSLLGADAQLQRAVALSALACTVPYCNDVAQTDALLAEALPLASWSGSRAARYVALVAQMYVQGGPAHQREADQAADELMQLQRQNPGPRMAVAPLYVALYRSVNALTRGDISAANLAVEHGIAHAREVRAPLLWHFERFRALMQVNTGAWAEGVPTLIALHRRAEQQQILGTEPFCAFDRIVVLGELLQNVPTLDDTLRSALDFDNNEPINIWSMKVRALATLGLLDEARATLRVVTPEALTRLPCGSQYVGSLGQLAQAVVRLGERDYAETLYTLLARYPQHYAANFSFLCEGSVSQLLGMLASLLGRHTDAVRHLEEAVQHNERAELSPRAAEARIQLATCLLEHGPGSERSRALTLVRESQRTAGRVGMRSLSRSAAHLLKTYDPV